MATGTVDVRMRDDNARHGKWRIDDLAAHLKTLEPKQSNSYHNFYKKMWNPDNFVRQSESDLLELKLSKSYFLGGDAPSQADKKALESLKGETPDCSKHPHTYGWYSIVSKFKPEVSAKWPEEKTKSEEPEKEEKEVSKKDIKKQAPKQ